MCGRQEERRLDPRRVGPGLGRQTRWRADCLACGRLLSGRRRLGGRTRCFRRTPTGRASPAARPREPTSGRALGRNVVARVARGCSCGARTPAPTSDSTSLRPSPAPLRSQLFSTPTPSDPSTQSCPSPRAPRPSPLIPNSSFLFPAPAQASCSLPRATSTAGRSDQDDFLPLPSSLRPPTSGGPKLLPPALAPLLGATRPLPPEDPSPRRAPPSPFVDSPPEPGLLGVEVRAPGRRVHRPTRTGSLAPIPGSYRLGPGPTRPNHSSKQRSELWSAIAERIPKH